MQQAVACADASMRRVAAETRVCAPVQSCFAVQVDCQRAGIHQGSAAGRIHIHAARCSRRKEDTGLRAVGLLWISMLAGAPLRQLGAGTAGARSKRP